MEYEETWFQTLTSLDPIDLILGRVAAYPSEPAPSLHLLISTMTSQASSCPSSECGNDFVLLINCLFNVQSVLQ